MENVFFFLKRIIYPLYGWATRQLFKRHDRLNVGCGSDFTNGWLNIGLFNYKFPYGLVRNANGAFLVHFDMRYKLPINEGSVRYIYASHFIEHLNFNEGIQFIRQCNALLRREGVLRLVFPDLELWVKNYYENNLKFFNTYAVHVRKYSRDDAIDKVKTKGEIFMSQIHGWGHKWGYDFDSIKHILSTEGFYKIRRKRQFDSLIPDIKRLESVEKVRLLESIYVEAVKK